MTNLVVKEKFTKTLGGRYRTDGPWSGQQFRDDILVPAVERALRANEKVVVNFDGVSGMPTSFLEEAFGGLIRVLSKESPTRILSTVEIEAPGSPRLFTFVELARTYMRNEARRRGA